MRIYCKEPAGEFLRLVEQLPPETEAVLRVYDHLGTCANLFGRRVVESIEQLIRDHWKFWLVDDVGLICFDPWIPGFAHIHITFWDRRLRGREHLVNVVIKSLMTRNNVHTVATVIPESSRVVAAFAKRAGMIPGKLYGDRRVYYGWTDQFMMHNPGM